MRMREEGAQGGDAIDQGGKPVEKHTLWEKLLTSENLYV